MTKIAIFGFEDWEKKKMEEIFPELELVFIESVLTIDAIPEETKNSEVLSVFVDSVVSKEVIESFPNLKLIVTRSTGFDHIDLVSAKAKGIVVSTVPAYGANTVAEHAFGLLLALSKRIVDGYEQLKESTDYNPKKLRGFDLSGKVLGVLGTGRIGQHSIRIGKGFGMEVIGFDAFPNNQLETDLGFTYVPTLEDFLSRADVVTIHMPYLPETHHMINKANIVKMKKGAVLINTSRGPIIETEALFNALENGHLRGAGLDVVEEEGLIKDEMHLLTDASIDSHNLKVALMNHKLIDMKQVIMTPHSAFNTIEALERILGTTIENIQNFFKGSPSNNVVK